MKRGLPDKVFAQGLRDMEPPRSSSREVWRSDEARLWAVRERVFKHSPQYKREWLKGKVGSILIYRDLTEESLEAWIEKHCGEAGPRAPRWGSEYSDDADDWSDDDGRDEGDNDPEDDGKGPGGAGSGPRGGKAAGGGGRGTKGGGAALDGAKKPRYRPADAPICAEASAPLDSSGETVDSIIPLLWSMDTKAFTPYGRPAAPHFEESENIPPVAPSKDTKPPLKKGHVLLQMKGNQAVTGPANKPKYLVSRMAAGKATWK